MFCTTNRSVAFADLWKCCISNVGQGCQNGKPVVAFSGTNNKYCHEISPCKQGNIKWTNSKVTCQRKRFMQQELQVFAECKCVMCYTVINNLLLQKGLEYQMIYRPVVNFLCGFWEWLESWESVESVFLSLFSWSFLSHDFYIYRQKWENITSWNKKTSCFL